MARAKKTIMHWAKKQLNSQEVRDAIKRVLINDQHKHFGLILRLLLPYAMADTIKAADGWSLKLPEPEVVVTDGE